ncbi:MAG: hypothetical protein Q4A06_00785 [Cardiobacteriaceae bacterium]|nr:hypothetical protein [Cardiobacteriaceae bacterium]
MKRSWLTLSLAATMLTGCGNMMYGPTPAPVVQQNSFLGPRVPLQNAQIPSQNGAFAQATRQAPPPQQPRYQTPQAPQPHYPPQNTQMQQPSPYTQPVVRPPAQRTPQLPQQANTGWDAQPQTAGNASPRVYDEPKLSGNNSAASNTAGTTPDSVTVNPNPNVNNRPAPLRPLERTPATDTAQAARPADSAEPPPPVQPVRRDADAAPQQNPPAESQEVASNKRPAASGSNTGGSAVSSLLRKASDSLGKGDMDGAVGYLENAQRIESKNPKILYDIANIRFHQGRHREADAMASRAVQTAQSSGDKAMEKKAWSLVSKARNELGDRQGALNAANKAAGL